MRDYAVNRPSNNGHAGGATDGLVWRDILVAARRRPWLVLAVPAVLLAATAFMVFRETSIYRATAVLRLGDARRALTSGLEAQAEPTRLMDPLLSETQILKSRALLGAVVDSLGMRLTPDFTQFPAALLDFVAVAPEAPADTLSLRFSATGVTVRGSADSATAAYGDTLVLGAVDGTVRFRVKARPKAAEATWIVQSRDEAIDRMLKHLRVASRTQTNVVDVTYTSHRPADAQQVVNLIVRTFQVLDARSAQDQSRRRRLFLDEQLRRADAILAQAQLALSAFRSRQEVYSSRDKLSRQQSDIAGLSSRRWELEAQRDAYRALLAKLQSSLPGEHDQALRALVSNPGVATNPLLTQLQAQLLKYQISLDSLTSGAWGSAATNPDVQRLRGLIASTEDQITRAMRSQLASLDVQIGAVQTQVSRSATAIRVLPAVEAQEVRLVQEVETSRRLGDQLREERQRAHMAEAVEVGQVEIVDVASLPYQPVSAYGMLKLVLAVLLGLGVGGGAALALEKLDPSIRRPEEIEDGLQLHSLAVIPKVDPAQVEGTEAYRVLRTNLLLAPEASRARTVVVTSAVPGEGKTTTAANLACSLAWEGRRVLLVDGDLWRGRLHRRFRGRRMPGFAECLLSDELIPAAIRTTDIAMLSFMPCGKGVGTPSDIVTSARLPRLLARLREQFELVLIDSPPVLATAEAVVLASSVDGVVLVVRAGQTDRSSVEQAMRQIKGVGARLVGAVLNDPADIARQYGYKNYYGSYYSTYSREDVGA
ncbi:MAG TPA: polysaccharide biosynthesis tyrosine autokinase [Candidatus Binatia bacterium]|nr:polysaccharide biosynthesis tyrosine autokinase [Candidatus Binatia bacterium]